MFMAALVEEVECLARGALGLPGPLRMRGAGATEVTPRFGQEHSSDSVGDKGHGAEDVKVVGWVCRTDMVGESVVRGVLTKALT